MKRITVIGLVGESVFLPVDHFHTGGETIVAKAMETQPGGKGFNQAITAARFGADTVFCAAIGNDGYHAVAERFLTENGVKPVLIRKPDRTAYAVILTDKHGTNHVTEYTGPSLEVSDVQQFRDEIASADYLLIGNETPAEVNLAAARIAAENHVKVICNPAPSRPIPEELMRRVDIFTPNEHETDGLDGCLDCIVTLGEKGCLDRLTGRHYDAEKVAAVDTTGAGDVFNGVLAARLAAGASREDAIRSAIRASGLSVTRRGAVTSIPYAEETEEV